MKLVRGVFHRVGEIPIGAFFTGEGESFYLHLGFAQMQEVFKGLTFDQITNLYAHVASLEPANNDQWTDGVSRVYVHHKTREFDCEYSEESAIEQYRRYVLEPAGFASSPSNQESVPSPLPNVDPPSSFDHRGE